MLIHSGSSPGSSATSVSGSSCFRSACNQLLFGIGNGWRCNPAIRPSVSGGNACDTICRLRAATTTDGSLSMAMVRDALITSTIDGDVGDHWRSSSNRFPLALLSNLDKKILLTRTQLRNDIDKCVGPLGLEELREMLP